MSVQRQDVVRFLDDYMRVDDFADGLPIGLQVEGGPLVRRVATAVSACVEVFEQAAEWGADMAIVHHGMFWEKDDRVVRGPLKRRLEILLGNNISLVGYHLPLDAHPEVGNNALFARGVGLRDIEPFAEYHGNRIGYCGVFDRMPIEEFVARASQFYGCEPKAALLEGPSDTVCSAGVVSGGAWPNMRDAIAAGLDVFVTGTADEPAFHIAREEGLHFLAFGHNATERVGVRALGDVVAKHFDLEVRFFDVDNPL